MLSKAFMRQVVLLSSVAVLAGCASLAGGSISTGTSSTASKGGAAGSASTDANSGLERCEETLGTLAVDDGRLQTGYYTLTGTRSTQVNSLLRLAVQQSNCFVITSIGNTRTEGKISSITDRQRNSGEFRAGSKQQKGQRVAADYLLEPDVVIDDSTTGKVAGGLAGFLPGALAGLAGSLETKASVVTLTLYDIRSGVQIGISEGNATSSNYGAALGALGGGAAGALGGFSKTPEGKATVAAFIDAYNNMVVSLRNYKAQTVKGGLGRGGRLKVAD